MAKCDEGYLCEVCGEEVEGIQHSDLYLRYVIGEMDPERLHTSPERHIGCNPVLAQFITADEFDCEVAIDDIPEGFAVDDLDASYSSQRRNLVTRGWRRLQELAALNETTPIQEYPLDQVREKWS